MTTGRNLPELMGGGGALSDDELERIRTHRENLTYAFYLELGYMDTYLAEGNEDLHHRIHEDGRNVCDSYVVQWCEKHLEEHGRLAHVLDFGAGVASSLLYLHRAGLAELVAADALGPEFQRLHALRGTSIPVASQLGIGELADSQFAHGSFDLVYIRNSLDHNQCPALTWLNLFGLVRVGGVLCHSHAIREATQESWQQLHRFDLFPRDESLWIEDEAHEPFSLTDDLPLEPVWCKNEGDAPKPWFAAGYRKLADATESARLYGHVLAQLRRAYERRSRWAYGLEGALMRESARRNPATRPLPIDVDPDRA